MGELNVNRLENALKGMTLGVVRSIDNAADRAYKDGLVEREEQFQIAFSGVAEEFFAWQTAEVKFGNVFVDATGQRDSELTVPHFTYGAELESPIPVGIMAVIMAWKKTDRDETIGCTLAVGAAATDQSTKFFGALHATFQGFGQPANTFTPEGLESGS
jgi:hypothetical protein